MKFWTLTVFSVSGKRVCHYTFNATEQNAIRRAIQEAGKWQGNARIAGFDLSKG